MKEILRAGDIVLPAPVAISVNDELIWSSDTGRLMDGTMAGEVIAQKRRYPLNGVSCRRVSLC